MDRESIVLHACVCVCVCVCVCEREKERERELGEFGHSKCNRVITVDSYQSPSITLIRKATTCLATKHGYASKRTQRNTINHPSMLAAYVLILQFHADQ